jgi:hypothetical protein
MFFAGEMRAPLPNRKNSAITCRIASGTGTVGHHPRIQLSALAVEVKGETNLVVSHHPSTKLAPVKTQKPSNPATTGTNSLAGFIP